MTEKVFQEICAAYYAKNVWNIEKKLDPLPSAFAL